MDKQDFNALVDLAMRQAHMQPIARHRIKCLFEIPKIRHHGMARASRRRQELVCQRLCV
jgi:hypothetical protein